jgi:hypothetical protein
MINRWYGGWILLSKKRFLVPSDLRDEVLALVQNIPRWGHQGVQRTKLRAMEKNYWCRMGDSVLNYVLNCDTCCRSKRRSPPSKAGLKSYQAECPMVHSLCTEAGNEYILMMAGGQLYKLSWREVNCVRPRKQWKETIDLHLRKETYQVGDLVYWRRNADKKVKSVWLGPGIIDEIKSDTLYIVRSRREVKGHESWQAQEVHLSSDPKMDQRLSSS